MDRNEQKEPKQDKNAFFSFLKRQLIARENYNRLKEKKDSKIESVVAKGGPEKCCLYLHGHPLQGQQIDYLFEFLDKHPEVTVLDLSDAQLGSRPDREIVHLLNCLKTNNTVEELNLEGNKIDFSGEVLSRYSEEKPYYHDNDVWKESPKGYYLYHTRIVPQALYDFLRENTKLTHLWLGSNSFRITSRQWRRSGAVDFYNLGLEGLGFGLEGNNTLRMLNMNACEIQLAHPGEIHSLDAFPNGVVKSGLTHLYLHNCKLELRMYYKIWNSIVTRSDHHLREIGLDDNPIFPPFTDNKGLVKRHLTEIETRLNQNRENYAESVMQAALISGNSKGEGRSDVGQLIPIIASLMDHGLDVSTEKVRNYRLNTPMDTLFKARELEQEAKKILLEIENYIIQHVKKLGAAKVFQDLIREKNVKTIKINNVNFPVAAKIAEIWNILAEANRNFDKGNKLSYSRALRKIKTIGKVFAEKPDPNHDIETKKFFALFANEADFNKAFRPWKEEVKKEQKKDSGPR